MKSIIQKYISETFLIKIIDEISRANASKKIVKLKRFFPEIKPMKM